MRCFFLSLPQTGIPPSDKSTSTADQREKSPSRNERIHKVPPSQGTITRNDAADNSILTAQHQTPRSPNKNKLIEDEKTETGRSSSSSRQEKSGKDYSSRFGLYIQKVRATRCRTEKAKAPRPNRDRKSPLRHKAALEMVHQSALAFRSSPAGTRRRD